MNKKFGFNELLGNNTFLIVLSLICAVIVWFTVVYRINTATEQTVFNVPVVIDVEDSALSRLELQPVTNTAFSVDVQIVGPQAVVGNITPDDILVSVRLSNVNGPGTYELALDKEDRYGKGFEITGTVPETVSIRFDRMVEKTMTVELDLLELEVPDEYVLYHEYVYPQEVVVSGPETEVSQISSCKVTKTFDEPQSQTTSYELDVIMLNANGEVFESPLVTLDSPTVTLTLPILKKKTIPVTISFTNMPDNFDVSTLDYDIFPNEIEVAGPVGSVNGLTELHLGYVDMRTLRPDASLNYTVSLPTGFISVENIRDVDVEFYDSGFDSKLLNVSDIRIINAPADYDVTVATKVIYGVTIYGPQESIDRLTAKDLVAEIDMNEADLRIGTVTVPVNIILPSVDDCWVYGDDYTAVVTIKAR